MSWGAGGTELVEAESRDKRITSSSVQHPSDLHSATPLGGGTPQHSKHLDSACGQPDVYTITTCTTRYTRLCRRLPQKIWSDCEAQAGTLGCRSRLQKRVAQAGCRTGCYRWGVFIRWTGRGPRKYLRRVQEVAPVLGFVETLKHNEGGAGESVPRH